MHSRSLPESKGALVRGVTPNFLGSAILYIGQVECLFEKCSRWRV